MKETHTAVCSFPGCTKAVNTSAPAQRLCIDLVPDAPRQIVFYSIGSYYFDLLLIVNLASVFQLYNIFERWAVNPW